MRLSIPPVFRGAAGALAALLAVVASPRRANAQELRAIVRDSASRQPIPTVVVILTDSAGTPIVRYLTNERGELRVAVTASVRRAQLLRIGFRPRDVALPPAAEGVIVLDLAMRAIPTLLEPVHVVDSPNCPRRDDRSAAFALWEQARAALLAAVVARESETAVIKRLHFDRHMGEDGFTPTSQFVHVDSSAGGRPFVASHPAAEFIVNGFVEDSANVAVFNGPDADVMLDDSFARGYCFALADADRARPHEIGLAFEAANHKRGRVDVEGAVWVDSTTRSLTEIVFRYVGIDRRFDAYKPGGNVSFRTINDGTPIIDRWTIRPVGIPTTSRRVVVAPSDMHETGGEVARVTWADGRMWEASLGALTGVATQNRVPAPGTIVTLVGTDYTAVADSNGRFEIPDLVPGPYELGVIDTRLSKIDLVLTPRISFVAARDSTVSIAFEAPTADQYAAAICPRRGPAVTVSTVIGRVVMPGGSAAAGADVVASVVTDTGLVVLSKGRVNNRGYFDICEVPVGSTLQIRADLDARVARFGATARQGVTRGVEAILMTLTSTPP